MRRRREKVLMLIVPVILLIILIILYRQFNKNGGTDGSITPFTTPTHAPTQTPTPAPVAERAGNPSGDKIKYRIYSDTTPLDSYQSADMIVFGAPETYSALEGITTFRGNHYRDGAAYGTRKVVEKKLEIVWTSEEIPLIDPQWPGVGWTGQPLIVHWPEKIRKIMNLYPEYKKKDFVEVIQATLGGVIYFLDLETGKPTRPFIDIGFPIKGTPLVDPRGYPVLYVGMGINSLQNGKTGTWKYRIFSLLDNSEIFSIPGIDSTVPRNWGAFDSTGLVHAGTDTFIQCGENGLLYKIKLNTDFDPENGKLSVSPEVIKYRYTHLFRNKKSYGIENSPAFYRDLIFFADNGGMLQCLDINTLKPKWAFNLGDDTDATPVIEETPDGVFLYIGNQVDHQNSGGYATVRKINALTGEQIWSRSYKCYKDELINGGVFSAAVVGTGDISDMVIFNISKTGTEWGGKLVALDKNTGEEIWVKDLTSYGWSSPVVFSSDDGKSYMIFCDSAGRMFLIDPKTGETLDTISVERNVESSPAIYNNMVVVGSYARKIFGIRIR
ncbi:pyrrolo-quinoline quinone repeat-containing protein [Thermoclostridium stercorarium subsp. stercorarium DSM 8532]|jgi:outer membrane protein assembly factor BamB|uniref:Pyrrolo-quinoline quinone repeat-containing protein n=4 Tax=Thermoclostridium stercorarium TaxID=1510 RepID=L7VM11_THES1|nr:PQQ-binding-like beta-propeller repeat protein [Thermoclostridium stercorarium]AGC67546.1 pyrrolo-quinoline quinone repeat-containing protein [Thermoclostridium stercorarium subsp. stercorarium DSM 8532]AGI38595.1 PQQ-like domain-containing protein [Thermoclostridium stercorarium subsp. stercorarium DSM 8532]ANW97970.1 pyrrolo-quinoline quinone [Thermoclostridium stercorarium subsp. thermolacticum DSM 2910]ANX00520.1 pyrrolo-quinoline quinone [Thermoclostridium stercorarium subsp. leptospart